MIPGLTFTGRVVKWKLAICAWCKMSFPWKHDRPECCGYPCAGKLREFRKRIKRMEEA